MQRILWRFVSSKLWAVPIISKRLPAVRSRLRVTVKDDSLVAPDEAWKNFLEALGVVRGKNSIQVIYGVRVVNITTAVKDILHID